jgi:5-methylcytosine-specific restriction endonuclease McrA
VSSNTVAIHRKGTKNLDTHGIVHIYNPVADHVVPWNLGGRTAPSNLVTSCGACNYGKDRYTIEQLGIQSPFLRSPKLDDWDGLTFLLDQINLKAKATS